MTKARDSKKLLLPGGSLVLVFIFLLTTITFSQQTVKRQPTQKRVPLKRLKVMKNDLTIRIVQCPKKVVKAGEDLKNGFQVLGRSSFATPLKDVAVDIVLTSKPTYPAPAPSATYSPNYSDNVLLKGGREHISFTGPGTVNVPLNGTNTIPADTPSGIYYLMAVIDSGNKVKESNERNNFHFCKIKVVGSNQPKKLPDLVIATMDFKKVKKNTDVQGNEYWIFNVLIRVKNAGNANAGPFKVLLERNIGPNGTMQQACQTCVIPVLSGLAAGQTILLPPRQFNNANNAKSKFRATADISGVVTESIETNNSKINAFN